MPRKAQQDPDESAEFDPLTSPAPELTPQELSAIKRRAYQKEYQKKRSERERAARAARPPGKPGRPPKSAAPAAPKGYEAVWAPLYKEDGTPGPQFALLSCPFPEIFFGGARGGGKALPLVENVVTPTGYRTMGEIKVGDKVHGPDATVVTVTGVYPQGSEDVFLITLVDGRNVRASRGHLWRIRVGVDEMTVTTDYIRGLMESPLEVSLPVETLDQWVAIKSVIYDGLDYTQCIRVDSADGLFLTNDEIVTHNTDGAIGKWLQHASRYGENAKGVFFRRRFKQLEDVQARCTQIFSRINAVYNKGDATWVFPNGAVLKLRHLWDIAATEEYHGHSYCVAEGTPILMADGSYRPIEAIQVDDLVMTLEGPKPVTATMAPGMKPCVRVEVFDSSGEKLGEQIHPENHRFLTRFSYHDARYSDAWQSYTSLLQDCEKDRDDEADRKPVLSCPVVLHSPDMDSLCLSECYDHPYTRELRTIDQPCQSGYVVLHPCEPHVVHDLTVKDANQYITNVHLINVNSFLCFEEVTNWSTPDAINRLRGTLRSSVGVMPELIMTGNPGGSGHCVPFGIVQTPAGWTDIKDLKVGDPVMTVTPTGEVVQTTVQQVHRSRYKGPMVSISNGVSIGGVSLTCTPNHKIAVVNDNGELDLTPVDELRYRDFSIPRMVRYNGTSCRLDEQLRTELDMSDCCYDEYDYDGEVYCIGVPDTHSFIIQQNGSIWISGNSWVKARYISPAPQGWTPIRDEETGELRIYIPSRLTDNSAMMKNDPTYANRLRGTGSASLVNAWLNGDWDIVAGGFFDDLIVPDKHFLIPFAIPSEWSYRRSFDWGSAAPASLGIWAVSDGNPVRELGGFVFPRGSLIRVKEWYTVAKTKSGDIIPNDGLRLTNIALGEGIAHRSGGMRFTGCVADPSIYSKLGRESIYDEMRHGARQAGHNLIMSPADNNRIGGWQKMRDMLESAGHDRPERPGLWVFETCHHWLRTVPVMQRSDTDFDDVDTTQEDHPADDTRYACMSGGRSMKIATLVGR